MLSNRELNQRLKKIRFLVCDVDGVLTDGGIWVSDWGYEAKCFSVLDGTGLVLARLGGLQAAFLSGRRSKVITLRARECGVRYVAQGVPEKIPAFKRLCARAGASAASTLYLGDDLIDLPVMGLAGVAVAVADAVPEVQRAAHWVTHRPGGRGAVREVVDRILKAQGSFTRVLASYLGPHAAKN